MQKSIQKISISFVYFKSSFSNSEQTEALDSVTDIAYKNKGILRKVNCLNVVQRLSKPCSFPGLTGDVKSNTKKKFFFQIKSPN